MLKFWSEFFDDLQNVRGRSRNTVLAYRRDLELYDKFTEQHTDITRLNEFLNKQGLSTRSQARVISSLRTYFRFCENRGVEAPELRQLRPPKVKNKLPKILAYEDFQKLYESAKVENVYRSGRNQIVLLLLYGTGCRVSELIALDLKDYNPTEAWICVTGKGGKQRIVPLTEMLQKELNDYLDHVRPHLIKKEVSSILVNDRGKRPSRVDIWRWLSAWSEKADFEETVHPHQFRHGCATALLESGADLRSIQMLLGHSSLQTTQIYTNVSVHKAKETIDRLHPLSEPES